LRQVLMHMDDADANVLRAFARSAADTLRRRVAAAPQDVHLRRWLPGWLNRVQTYEGFGAERRR